MNTSYFYKNERQEQSGIIRVKHILHFLVLMCNLIIICMLIHLYNYYLHFQRKLLQLTSVSDDRPGVQKAYIYDLSRGGFVFGVKHIYIRCSRL